MLALALIGWYLMMPPAHQVNGEWKLDADAPLSSWELVSSYDSAHECETFRGLDKLAHEKAETSGPSAAASPARQHELCLATDDPRIKAR